MKVLFNHKCLFHNIDSDYEGAYRLKDFKDKYPDVEANGEAYLSLVHSDAYINWIRDASRREEIIAEVLMTRDSYEAACIAVGLAIAASGSNDFAVVRPPGHHAGREKAIGFCLFNNMAIATSKLVKEGKKVFILDIDGHHGNGTQSIFYGSNRVLYCSVHQYRTFPYTGFPDETGVAEGLGFTLNIPLIPGSGDKEFLDAVELAIAKAKAFQPDHVGVSAGFDGYHKDRLLNLNYTLKAYYECGYRLRRNFKNVFAVLEGGYHEEMKQCVDQFIKGVNQGAKPSRIKWDSNLSIG
jgi:acetoin utilization deacetylase AcuC-like enzyme